MMKSQGSGVLILLTLAAFATSCASSKDVDVTTTLRKGIDAHIGKGWSSDSTRIENISDSFGPNETVYATVDVPGSVDAGTVRVRWIYGESEVIDERTMSIQSGVNVYPFRLTPPSGGLKPGDYTFEVYLNDDRAETEKFKVVA